MWDCSQGHRFSQYNYLYPHLLQKIYPKTSSPESYPLPKENKLLTFFSFYDHLTWTTVHLITVRLSCAAGNRFIWTTRGQKLKNIAIAIVSFQTTIKVRIRCVHSSLCLSFLFSCCSIERVRRMARGGAEAFPYLSLISAAFILLLFTSGCQFHLHISILSSSHTEIS